MATAGLTVAEANQRAVEHWMCDVRFVETGELVDFSFAGIEMKAK